MSRVLPRSRVWPAVLALLAWVGIPARGGAQVSGQQVAGQKGAASTALDVDSLPDEAFLAAGEDLLRRAGPEEALAFYRAAWDELTVRGRYDPRLGPAAVQAALASEDSTGFAAASEIYIGSLGSPLVPGAREALEEELDRLLPLMGPDERERFEGLRAADDRTLAFGVKQFWIERDPTPASPVNERLMEHWSRIEHSRKRFVNGRRPPLGTDARGLIYMKYGEPARVVKGSLGASELELQIRVPRDREARQRIRQYDPNPQYEVWVYERLNEKGFTFFLFGNRDGTGPFDLVDGVHELIYPAAKSQQTARFTPGGIPASNYMELFYYQDLSKLGGHFGTRFSELDQLWNNYTYRSNTYVAANRTAPTQAELRMFTDRYRQEDEFFPPGAPTIEVESEFEGRARDELVGQSIRVLSDDDVPLLVTLGASAPRLATSRASAYTGELQFSGWLMRHSLIIRDRNLDEVGRLVQPVDPRRADVSSFVVRHVEEPLHLTLTAQTLLPPSEDAPADTLVDSERLPGLVHFQPDAPLDTDPDRFQVSDLLTGTAIPPELGYVELPYPLLPARSIWIQDLLRVYLEFYHMGTGSDGRALLDARFRVVPLDEDGLPDEDRDPVTLEVTLTPDPRRAYREAFDMQLRDQEPGRYRLEVEVEDRVRRQRRVRTVELELVR